MVLLRRIWFCLALVLTLSAQAVSADVSLDSEPDIKITSEFSAGAIALSDTHSSEQNALDDLNPFDPNIEAILEEFDKAYEAETGMPSHLPIHPEFDPLLSTKCYRATCRVFALVDKSAQRLYLYLNGNPIAEWKVSTGVRGYRTPDFDRHPNGRIYDRYTSRRYPGGNYKNLGNMPYAVFIQGGFAIHGTGEGNWRKLGSPASHGCIRLHPDNAYRFNRLVRESGIHNVWITVR